MDIQFSIQNTGCHSIIVKSVTSLELLDGGDILQCTIPVVLFVCFPFDHDLFGPFLMRIQLLHWATISRHGHREFKNSKIQLSLQLPPL